MVIHQISSKIRFNRPTNPDPAAKLTSETVNTEPTTYRKHTSKSSPSVLSSYKICTTFQMDNTRQRQLVQTKDPLQMDDRTNCLYKNKCLCDCIYIAPTGKQLKLRINEHKRHFPVAPISANKLERNSAIAFHALVENHRVKLNKTHMLQPNFDRLEYFKDWNNYLEFLLNALAMTYSALTLVLHVDHHYVGLGVIVMFLAWFNFLLQMMRFNHVGIYVVMFLHVLATVGKCLVVFSVVFVAFALSFHVLFRIPQYKEFLTLTHKELASVENCFGPQGQFEALGNGNNTQKSVPVELQSFQYVGLSLFKTLFMMLGEYEHTATIVEPLTGHSPLSIHYPVITLFFYVGFIFLVPIILMNLLIGLAVGDIEHVRQSSVLRLISQQVYWLADWEPKLMSIFRSKIYSPYWKRKCKRDANVTLRRALRSALRIYMYRDISNIVVTGTLGGLVQHIQLPGNITSERLSWFPGLSINTDEPVRLASVLAATSACQPIPTASGVSKSIV
ncbi:Transient receptor putative cation channel sub A member 1 [Clonorchis sinensis]|uniref:Transient receptor putative cation channel sub A member 1 n=1 Tax=Clonorchis sinensis TaxID=79923 RepID=A0A3R7D2R2_CLOSI|nr:Transient receptor putative cation channel sub A member 1 [Clonorchis sinensis]